MSAILDNLLSNAIQYATPGSDVILDLSTAENSVCVSITNQQQHLKPSDLEHLFDPFWRKDSARDGGQHVGLGLAITRAYCDAIGATVEARLMTDQQFCVSVTLQRVAAPSNLKSVPLGVSIDTE